MLSYSWLLFSLSIFDSHFFSFPFHFFYSIPTTLPMAHNCHCGIHTGTSYKEIQIKFYTEGELSFICIKKINEEENTPHHVVVVTGHGIEDVARFRVPRHRISESFSKVWWTNKNNIAYTLEALSLYCITKTGARQNIHQVGTNSVLCFNNVRTGICTVLLCSTVEFDAPMIIKNSTK